MLCGESGGSKASREVIVKARPGGRGQVLHRASKVKAPEAGVTGSRPEWLVEEGRDIMGGAKEKGDWQREWGLQALKGL